MESCRRLIDSVKMTKFTDVHPANDVHSFVGWTKALTISSERGDEPKPVLAVERPFFFLKKTDHFELDSLVKITLSTMNHRTVHAAHADQAVRAIYDDIPNMHEARPKRRHDDST